MDFPGRLIVGFIVVILIFIFPLQYIAQSNSESIDFLVDDKARQLVELIRDKGYLEVQMYEEFMNYLDTTGELYELEIQDIRPVKGEDYSLYNMKESKKASFERVSYNSVLPFATHLHTDACYDGDKHAHTSQTGSCYSLESHSHSGNSTYGGECYSPIYHSHSGSSSSGGGCYGRYISHTHSSDCYHTHGTACYTSCRGTWREGGMSTISTVTHSCGGTKSIKEYYATCSGCGTRISRGTSEVCVPTGKNQIGGCGTLRGVPSMPTHTCSTIKLTCSLGGGSLVCTKSSYYERNCGKTTSSIDGYYLNCSVTDEYKLTCNKIVGDYYKGNTKVSATCNNVVTSITASNPTQTVIKGNSIVTTATATYLDGHTGTVNCTSNYNPNLVGNQTVTLTYSGVVGNAKTTGTRTCKVNVTVKPDKNLISIIATPISQIMQRYTWPVFTVRAYYSDGTNRELNSTEYSISGFNAKNICIQNVTIAYTENGITSSSVINITITALQRECPRCKETYELNPDDTDPGCPWCKELIQGIRVSPDHVEVQKGHVLPIAVMAIYNDDSTSNVSGWTSNYDPQRVGLQIVTIEYNGFITDISVWINDELISCPICEINFPKSESSCPVCAETVKSISVWPKEITVMQYEPISLMVTAHYADGSSRDVNEWSIDRNTMSSGTFVATVNYKGVSESVILNILSVNSVKCPICGVIYNIVDNPKGCPICSDELIGIEAYLTSGSNLVQLGATPDIAVILIFHDGHREFAKDGYVLEDFNPQELGMQTVRVIYKGFFTTIILEVVNILDGIICPNGHVYYNAENSEEECPFCHVGDEISKILYFDIIYTDEILDKINSVGAYHFKEGNYISVILTKKDKSLLYRLQNTFFSTSILGRKKRYIYGGEVY